MSNKKVEIIYKLLYILQHKQKKVYIQLYYIEMMKPFPIYVIKTSVHARFSIKHLTVVLVMDNNNEYFKITVK